MYDEDSSVAQWMRWIARLTVATLVVAAFAGWYYLHPPQKGPWSKTAQENVAMVRDHSRSESQRRLAADALEHADASIVPDLIAELMQGDPLGRELAAMALGRLERTASTAVEPLIAALDDPASRVRERAAMAVGQVCSHPQTVVAAMQKVLLDGDANVREKAFETLGHQEAAGAAALAELLTDPDADVRRRAAIELGRMGSAADGACNALRSAMNDSDALVRASTYVALVKHSAIRPDELAQGIADCDSVVKSTIGDLFQRTKISSDKAVAVLAKLLDSDDEDTAYQAANALRQLGPAARPAFSALLGHLDDSRDFIGNTVLHTLRGIGPEAEFRPPELFDILAADAEEIRSLILFDPDRGRTGPGPTGWAPRGYDVSDDDMARVSRLPHLEFLDLSETAISDAGLAHLNGLSRLQRLTLDKTKVTSAGLAYVSKMKQLRSLSLSDCAITNEGLRLLCDLEQLESLNLNGTAVTDEGIRELTCLSQIRSLQVFKTAVTDAGLAHLTDLPALEDLGGGTGQFTVAGLSQIGGLKRLAVYNESITDADLAPLERMTTLRELKIDGPSITDATLATVSKLKTLEALALTGTQITDAGIKQLITLTKLRSLRLNTPGVAIQGALELANALPGLKVHLPLATVPRYGLVGLDQFGLGIATPRLAPGPPSYNMMRAP